ncbi:MAG: hypothetical protein MR704_20500 [Clostridia bacterium]|nr:hypothetical protein [Clostridia bacterium]
MLNFYDFEVFSHNWLVVIINPATHEQTVIIDDPDKLNTYYEEHKKEVWIGYNSRHYDQYILKAILCDFDPKEVNDYIIVQGNGGWQFSNLFNKIKVNNYDVMSTMHGLKQLEGFMGNNIKESDVPFDIDRLLTQEEIEETVQYCIHDVEQTIEVFIRRKDEFDAVMGLIKAFQLPLSSISKTKAQLSARILEASKQDREDEWEIEFVDTLDIKKYAYVMDWFLSHKTYKDKLTTIVSGVEHTFAWGGLHGAREKYHHKCKAGEIILHVDVSSFYPAIMIEYDLLSRNVKDPKKYRDIRDLRLKYKAEKNPLAAPYKIVLNSTYGICKDKYSPMYDPRQANMICINGQLLLLDLLEHLEQIPSYKLIQSNTDGLIILINESDFALTDDICYEWEKRTHMELGFDYITEIWQKDVNNYVFIEESGALERKGAYVKNLSDLDYDLAIVNIAMVKYMTEHVPVEVTINACQDLRDFQKIVKVSSKYKKAWHNGEYLNDKTFRVFASKDSSDTYIGRIKEEGATVEKFANTPDKCFIDNGSIHGKSIPSKLDRQWYIDLATVRLRQYGVDV